MKTKTELKNTLDLICRRMFETRPKTQIRYMPYTHPDFVTRRLRQEIEIDLNKCFPNAQNGDFAYVHTALKSSAHTDLSLLVLGADAICLNGEDIPVSGEAYEQNGKIFTIVPIQVGHGYNDLIFKCTKSENGFGVHYQVSHVSYPFLWVCDYLLWERDTVPLPEFADEQGFCVSELLRPDAAKAYADCNIVFPIAKAGEFLAPEQTDGAQTYIAGMAYYYGVGEAGYHPKDGGESDSNRIYLIRTNRHHRFLESYVSHDCGKTYTFEQRLRKIPKRKNIKIWRPYVPVHAQDNLPVYWHEGTYSAHTGGWHSDVVMYVEYDD